MYDVLVGDWSWFESRSSLITDRGLKAECARSGRRAGLAAHGPRDRRVNVWGNAYILNSRVLGGVLPSAAAGEAWMSWKY